MYKCQWDPQHWGLKVFCSFYNVYCCKKTSELQNTLIMILQNNTVPKFSMSVQYNKPWVIQKTVLTCHLHSSTWTVSDTNGTRFLGHMEYFMCKCNKILHHRDKYVLAIYRIPMNQWYIEKPFYYRTTKGLVVEDDSIA